MKHDFKKMEEEMDKLKKNMSTITDFSEKITGTLQGKRQQITKLSGVHALLKKVQIFYCILELIDMKKISGFLFEVLINFKTISASK